MRSPVLFLFGLVAITSTWASQQDLQDVILKAVEERTEYYKELEPAHHENVTGHYRRSHKSTPVTRKMDIDYAVLQDVVQKLMHEHNLPLEAAHREVRQAASNLAGCTVPQSSQQCPADKFTRYRTFDGTCNNPNNPDWGAAMTRQRRILAPAYCNGDQPRGCTQSRLQNARTISAKLHFNNDFRFRNLTNMVHQFGQFLDHDLSLTPEAGRQCCQQGGLDCWPIGDSSGVIRQRTCIDFTRSTACLGGDRNRQQTNRNTAFIDCSQVYGSDSQRAAQLRAGTNGALLTSRANGAPSVLLPRTNQNANLQRNNVQGDFIAGDDRINEMPGLAVLHNLFLLEHNRIAQLLKNANPNAPDNAIYMEARRIVGGEMQAIVYGEYLPAILGSNVMNSPQFNLRLPTSGSSCTTYNTGLDPSILNDFSTAAYRFGHTLVSEFVSLLNPSGTSRGFVEQYRISDNYFQSGKVTKNNGRGFHEILTGLTETNCQDYDPFVVDGLTLNLFRNATSQQFGSDLIARNIQRGRDHGLPSYNAYRRWYGLEELNFNNAPRDWRPEGWAELRKVYQANGNTAEDVDLFPAALMEIPPGGASGITFQLIKADQFNRLKFGDRLFFTHCDVFTADQRAVFLRRRLSDIICENSVGVKDTEPEKAFSKNGVYIPCNHPSRKFDINPFVRFPYGK
ncbi:unnamed protein product [Allacma fusca]|uniref:Peroxidase n=1 Tax=Allacma fusca TaxID=39272 RepID=A0A8J2Q4L1_9HEXA|nr:unnamed protein product [Allacma fusca]